MIPHQDPPDKISLGTLLRELPLIEYRMDSDGICTRSVGAGLARYGASDGDFVGSSPLEDFPGGREAMLRAYAGEKVIETLSGDYEGQPWAMLTHLVPDGDGGIIGFCVDVTDRYLAEEALAREEARYRLLADNISDVIVVIDSERKVVYTSPSVSAVLGYSPEELVGRSYLELVHPDDLAEIGVLPRPGAIGESQTWQARVLHATGGWTWIEGVGRYVAVPEGGWCLQVSVRDVRERKLHEADLNRATERAEAASRAKSAFLANMSTEIADPLRSILDAADRAGLAEIRSTGAALLRLVEDILDFADLEAGRLELVASTVRVDQLVTYLMHPFEQAAMAKGLGFAVRIDGEVAEGPVVVDQTRLGQVLSALVDNAVKFTDTGNVDVTVTRGGDDRFRFVVADTGPGISAEEQAELFEAFQRGERRHDGTGLGLALARRITDLMGGTLEVESVQGAGSTFTLSVVLPGVVPGGDNSDDGATPRRVLLVEDDPDNRAVARQCLERLGHHVETAETGAGALMVLAQSDVDLVLVDCDLPDMDGCEVARRIRLVEMREGASRLPVVGVTIDPVPTVRDRCSAAGMDDVVAKPYTPEMLGPAISNRF